MIIWWLLPQTAIGVASLRFALNQGTLR